MLRAGAVQLCVDAMRDLPSHSAVNAGACGVLSQLAKDAAACAQLVSAGAVELITQILGRFVKPAASSVDAKVCVEGAATALETLATHSEGARIVLSTPARAQLLIDALAALPQSRQLTTCSGRTWVQLCKPKQIGRLFLSRGAVPALMVAMQANIESDMATLCAAAAVFEMIDSENNSLVPEMTDESSPSVGAGAGAGGSAAPLRPHVKTLVQAMRLHLGEFSSVHNISMAIAHVAYHKANAEALHKLGVTDVLCEALRRYGRDLYYCHAALSSLARIAHSRDSPSPMRLAAGFGTTLAEVMCRHQGDRIVIDSGLRIVRDQLPVAPFCTDWARSGGAKLVVALSKASIRVADAEGMKAEAQDLLPRLLAARGTSPFFMQAGVGVASIAALRTASSASGIAAARQAAAQCTNIASLTLYDADAIEKLAYMGAAEALVAALASPAVAGAGSKPGDASAALAALLALRNIAASESVRPRMMSCGAPAAVVSTLKAQLARKASAVAASGVKQADLCAAGCAALRNLSASPATRVALMGTGASEVGLLALRSPDCLRSAESAWAACGLLAGLSCELNNGEALLRAGVVAEAAKAMQQHLADRRIGWAVSCILQRLSEAACAATAGAGGSAAASGAGRSLSALSELESGVCAALSLHGAADARAAAPAVAAAKALALASAAGGRAISADLRRAVEAALAAHQTLAARGATRSAGAAAQGRRFLEMLA